MSLNCVANWEWIKRLWYIYKMDYYWAIRNYQYIQQHVWIPNANAYVKEARLKMPPTLSFHLYGILNKAKPQGHKTDQWSSGRWKKELTIKDHERTSGVMWRSPISWLWWWLQMCLYWSELSELHIKTDEFYCTYLFKWRKISHISKTFQAISLKN